MCAFLLSCAQNAFISKSGVSVPTFLLLDKLAIFLERAAEFIRAMQRVGYEPNASKELLRTFPPSVAAEMVGKTAATLARAEAQLGIEIAKRSPSMRRAGYTLSQIQTFREHFGTLPGRNKKTDDVLFFAFQNFKGGVGKSTTCINIAHGLALKGYKVLVVDADHQASTTAMFGYYPDRDFTASNTIIPYMEGKEPDLNYCLLKTYWPNIDLIPSCMALGDAEWGLFEHVISIPLPERPEVFREFRSALDTVSADYDVVLIDSPPSNGMIALSVMVAADCLVVPTAARMFDFASTTQFMNMTKRYMKDVDVTKAIRWQKILITMFDGRTKSQHDFVDVFKDKFGDTMLNHLFLQTAAIGAAATRFQTPYEQPVQSKQVIEMLDGIVNELELLILREWPSKRKQLQQRGLA
jgi:chromosome partitioning protein